ncbi:SGNH/GDSL hydrolase family protein [Falsiroseomonas tokyonensis]|uniref:SGNH/GDSL hydrolase family protein n=1 Tax=Falsiroseomonas tokyonensis TaxID=430521 RepID=A0ABV7BV52_9PROT|nr:SGNH/GDSL hydrolase family protein [Falsiroseomonas tokyonensis]MBU8538511.1 SGNH/GDSL hydrolase family protein [Falsiroseomonas tokyonensis]
MPRAPWLPLPALAALLAAALAVTPGPALAQAEGPGCGAPAETMEAAPMPGVFAALAHTELRILVVGSASTQGGGTSSQEATWPERLQAILAARIAPVSVQLKVFGGRGTTAADHAKILAEQGPRVRPHLIIWQLGTVEAARGLPMEEMAEVVQAAIARLRAIRGERTDVVLMDPQFSRFLRSNADVEAYRDWLRVSAAASGAQMFSRWVIMRHWVETERLDLERAPRARRLAVADELHDCLAKALTEFILDGALRGRRHQN